MAVNIVTAADADAWAFVRSLVTLGLVTNSTYGQNKTMMLIEIESSRFIDENTNSLVRLFASLGIEAEDGDVKRWHIERLAILLGIDPVVIPHQQGRRPDIPYRLPEDRDLDDYLAEE